MISRPEDEEQMTLEVPEALIGVSEGNCREWMVGSSVRTANVHSRLLLSLRKTRTTSTHHHQHQFSRRHEPFPCVRVGWRARAQVFKITVLARVTVGQQIITLSDVRARWWLPLLHESVEKQNTDKVP